MDFNTGLERGPANHQPLTPLLFLERAAAVFPDHLAVVHGTLRRSYRELRARCNRLASALWRRGIEPGDVVAALLPNIPEMVEAHYGVPMANAVLNTINTRLDADTVAYILGHGEAKAVVVDREFAPVLRAALAMAGVSPLVVEVDDPEAPEAARANTLGGLDYEALLAEGDPGFAWEMPRDEWDAITLNYTSGTTGRPKGVQYTYRGAYLNALNEVIVAGLSAESVYLWTLPMFHCDGWCFPWAVTAVAARHVAMRAVDAERAWDLIDHEGVTNYNGAPTVHLMLMNHPRAHPVDPPVTALVAAAPPSPTLFARMTELNFRAVHVYGLTETYGPVTVCPEQETWRDLPVEERAKLLARQGQAYISSDLVRVVDDDMNDVAQDGETMGEVIMRGNNVMSGYFQDEAATAKAFKGGWFHSGDLAVWHPDGNIELRDRAKDIIISGGENISSIEVEQTIVAHPAVLECAVIGIPHEHWGERPKAFVTLRDDAAVTAEELIAFCRERIARYKCPDAIEFTELPKTSTGKVQKFVLRERESQRQ
jgi:fatty-acyl-CoA synthase